MLKSLVLTDPVYQPRPLNRFERFVMHWLNDERDLPIAWLLMVSAIVLGGGAVYLYSRPFHWAIGAVYLVINVAVFLGPFTLLLHNVSHRPLFKRKYRWMNRLVPWAWGPLFGQTPESYFVHHVGMHHAENNMREDASSTLCFERDNPIDFLRYWARFMLVGTADLILYFKRHGKRSLLRRLWRGELIYLSAVTALLIANWRATLVILVIPLFTIRFLMMAGNWAQHAFIDLGDPENPYRNSITCINSSYNRRCFNDGYHIGHHIKMNRHWTELPLDFERNLAAYEREQAIVFEGIDFFGVWACLMFKRYDWLAKRYVNMSDSRKSPQEIMALLKARTRPAASASTLASATV